MQKSHLRSCCPLSKMERGPHHGVGFAQLSWREFRVAEWKEEENKRLCSGQT